MPCPLPPENLDHIVDHLHDDPTTLKACCVVSKSWIHRTRTHLFASVEFCAPKFPIERWKKTFPDPSNSPAHHTRHLYIHGYSAYNIRAVHGWIRAFHSLVHLQLGGHIWTYRGSLVPFDGLSPTLRSLHLKCDSPEVFDLICSFPLLEHLALVPPSLGSEIWNIPPTSPKLTGSLSLRGLRGICHSARRLLSLPNGLHFTKITVALDEGTQSVIELVSRCSDTLESFNILYYTPGMSP
jgi:hypothetical protein